MLYADSEQQQIIIKADREPSVRYVKSPIRTSKTGSIMSQRITNTQNNNEQFSITEQTRDSCAARKLLLISEPNEGIYEEIGEISTDVNEMYLNDQEPHTHTACENETTILEQNPAYRMSQQIHALSEKLETRRESISNSEMVPEETLDPSLIAYLQIVHKNSIIEKPVITESTSIAQTDPQKEKEQAQEVMIKNEQEELEAKQITESICTEENK